MTEQMNDQVYERLKSIIQSDDAPKLLEEITKLQKSGKLDLDYWKLTTGNYYHTLLNVALQIGSPRCVGVLMDCGASVWSYWSGLEIPGCSKGWSRTTQESSMD